MIGYSGGAANANARILIRWRHPQAMDSHSNGGSGVGEGLEPLSYGGEVEIFKIEQTLENESYFRKITRFYALSNCLPIGIFHKILNNYVDNHLKSIWNFRILL